jgi:hypothetical protein
MKYRIPEPGTTISGFADNKKKKKKIGLVSFHTAMFLCCYFFHIIFTAGNHDDLPASPPFNNV